MITRLDHVAITVGDLERSIDFYTKHFGLDPYFVERDRERGPKHIAYLKSPQGVVELTYMPERPLGEGFHFCFVCDDFDATFDRLVSEGVSVKAPAHHTAAREAGEEKWLRTVFSGPDGEEVELRGPSARGI